LLANVFVIYSSESPTYAHVSSEQTTILEVVLDDNICDSIKHKLDVVGVSGTRHMAVYLFCCGFVLGFKLGLDLCCSLSIFLRTYVRHKALITG
jgi:hypothetical protein